MSPEQMRAVMGAINVAMAYGFTTEVMPNGRLRFRCGKDTGTANVVGDGARTARLTGWCGTHRPAIRELADALR